MYYGMIEWVVAKLMMIGCRVDPPIALSAECVPLLP